LLFREMICAAQRFTQCEKHHLPNTRKFYGAFCLISGR
jgi:hypothetical protein